MELFFIVVTSGFAVAYVVELAGALLRSFRDDRIFKHLITPPLAAVACLYLNVHGFSLPIAISAVAFVATSLRVLLDAVTSKPVVVPRRR